MMFNTPAFAIDPMAPVRMMAAIQAATMEATLSNWTRMVEAQQKMLQTPIAGFWATGTVQPAAATTAEKTAPAAAKPAPAAKAVTKAAPKPAAPSKPKASVSAKVAAPKAPVVKPAKPVAEAAPVAVEKGTDAKPAAPKVTPAPVAAAKPAAPKPMLASTGTAPIAAKTPDAPAQPAPKTEPKTEPKTVAKTGQAASGQPEMVKPAALKKARKGQADDLKVLKGVGPKLEAELNDLGYFHYDQIAGWTEAEVAWADENLPGVRGRVTRNGWVEQAAALSAGKA